MRYVAIASDGDGTLIKDERMDGDVAKAIEDFRAAGGMLFLVTGERVEELSEFPRLDLIDHVVAENGAVIVNPATGDEEILCETPPSSFADALRRAGVQDVVDAGFG